ncbi:hypothetical protein K505DRAFT_396170 [Melanomma pulvis-pyrius CBS 109.77]|uniref:Uncharacterized protein n=1 Tax=Melanomma pulvis-pyrius CBS 109.77 TaxID=1314802 RepID=A0A6A6XNC3_9PLEO|nr:hypothetical protein K505DRAFT_396170 [Melanomma pulvis-pyrius CBS 109.77]
MAPSEEEGVVASGEQEIVAVSSEEEIIVASSKREDIMMFSEEDDVVGANTKHTTRNPGRRILPAGCKDLNSEFPDKPLSASGIVDSGLSTGVPYFKWKNAKDCQAPSWSSHELEHVRIVGQTTQGLLAMFRVHIREHGSGPSTGTARCRYRQRYLDIRDLLFSKYQVVFRCQANLKGRTVRICEPRGLGKELLTAPCTRRMQAETTLVSGHVSIGPVG